MKYVDAFVAPVPAANREQYMEHRNIVAAIFKEHGATSYVECWGDDLPDGEITSFPLAVKRSADETVCLGWAVWPSRDFCDQTMRKLMRDERLSPANCPLPFDCKRLIFGGFEVIVDV